MGREKKLPENRVRRNKPETFTVIPNELCSIPIPEWPLEKVTESELAYWNHLWSQPLAWYWHDQNIQPHVIARYVRTYITEMITFGKAKLSTSISKQERDLGLHLESMIKLRIVFESDDEDKENERQQSSSYRHLKAVES